MVATSAVWLHYSFRILCAGEVWLIERTLTQPAYMQPLPEVPDELWVEE